MWTGWEVVVVVVDDSMRSIGGIRILAVVGHSLFATNSSTAVIVQSLGPATRRDSLDVQYILQLTTVTKHRNMPFLRTRKFRADTLFRS